MKKLKDVSAKGKARLVKLDRTRMVFEPHDGAPVDLPAECYQALTTPSGTPIGWGLTANGLAVLAESDAQ